MIKILAVAIGLTLPIAATAGGYFAQVDKTQLTSEEKSAGRTLKQSTDLNSLTVGYNPSSNAVALKLGYSLTFSSSGEGTASGRAKTGNQISTPMDYESISAKVYAQTPSGWFNTRSTRGFNNFGLEFAKWTKNVRAQGAFTGYSEEWDSATLFWTTGFVPKNKGLFANASVKIPLTTSLTLSGADFGGAGDVSLSPRASLGLEAELGYSLGPALSVSAYFSDQLWGESSSESIRTVLGSPIGAVTQPDTRETRTGLKIRSQF